MGQQCKHFTTHQSFVCACMFDFYLFNFCFHFFVCGKKNTKKKRKKEISIYNYICKCVWTSIYTKEAFWCSPQTAGPSSPKKGNKSLFNFTDAKLWYRMCFILLWLWLLLLLLSRESASVLVPFPLFLFARLLFYCQCTFASRSDQKGCVSRKWSVVSGALPPAR